LTEIGGIFPSLCTICSDSGEIDPLGERRLVEFVIEKGVHGIAAVIGGGEYYKYSDGERQKLMEIIVDAANGKVPVYVGVSCPSTEPTLKLSKYAEDVGADGVIILPPFFAQYRPSESELQSHFRIISNSINIPVMIQDADPLGAPVSPKIMAGLALSNENINSIKVEGSRQLSRMAETLRLTHKKVRIFGGAGGVRLAEELRVGAHGSIPGCSTPEWWVGVFNGFEENGYAGAVGTGNKWRRYMRFMTSRGFPNPIWTQLEKEVLKMRGVIDSTYTRIPKNPLDQELLPKLRAILESLELINQV